MSIRVRITTLTVLAALAVAPAAPAQGPNDVPLTPARVDQMIKALRAGHDILAQRDALKKRQSELYDQASKIDDSKDLTAYDDARSKSSTCRSQAFQKINERHRSEVQAKAMTPAFQSKMMAMQQEYGMKIATAMQKNDQAEMKRLQDAMTKQQMAIVGLDLAKDTAEVDKQCGREAAKPASVARRDSLNKQAQAINDQVRQLEERARQAEVAASGMNATQYAQARERIINFLFAAKSNPVSRAFTPAEMSALSARQTELKALLANR